ncbi:MAG TPA: aminotransferase class V-fold PLP-dependent enzyme [Solirubrobacteraceae bacterium]
MNSRDLLTAAAHHAADFLATLPEARVEADVLDVEAMREALAVPLADGPTESRVVLDELVAAASPGIVRSQSPRYFGFVIGGAMPAAIAADVMAAAWDQNAGGYALSPAAAVAEEVAGAWIAELLGLPPSASFGLTTGCQMAHVTCLAAARHAVLADAGWDVDAGGLQGAPRVRIVVSEERHVTIDRAARLLGFGNDALVPVAVDAEGRMEVAALRAALAEGEGPTIVCAQAGDVNTGGFDPLGEIVDAGHAADAWVHVDGAFGLWAAVSARHRHLVDGAERADSWATDAHKWLNVPYDCGLAFVARPGPHATAMSASAAYLKFAQHGERDGCAWVPDFSRRARGFAVYAALRSLGRTGVAELVERCCACARRFAEVLAAEPRVAVLNDVVLNQVLVRFDDDDDVTDAVVAAVQAEGTCWMGSTTWRGRRAMRISVANWATRLSDVDRSCAAILDAVRAPLAPPRSR